MRITAAIEGDIKDCREKILLPSADDLTAEIKQSLCATNLVLKSFDIMMNPFNQLNASVSCM